MELPKNERRVVNSINKKTIWLYGAPFSGKTYLANKFPDPLMLNTDGNIKFIDAPYIAIKDVVTVEGRMTKRQFAWDVFKETIAELEKKQNDFKTIVVDLIEDTYEYCRLYMYDKLGIEHESDDSFRAWDKVRTEFLSTIKRLINLDYENIILISHEDTSKDLTKRSGDKITAIKPNLQDKAALKIAGMVDLVCRVIAEDGTRTLSFKNSEVIFGGGRLNVKANEISCEYEELIKVYDEANIGKVKTVEKKTARKTNGKAVEEVQSEKSETNVDYEEANGGKTPVKTSSVEPKQEEKQENVPALETATAEPVAETSEQPVRRTRKKKVVEEKTTEEMIEDIPFAETPSEEPKRRTRKKRTED